MWRFYCIYTHLIMIPNWRLKIRIRIYKYIIHPHIMMMLWGAFSFYINTSDFPDPDLSRAELNNLTYLTFWCWWTALSLQYLCPSHSLWPGASNTIKQRAEPPGTTPSTSPSHLLTCCYQPLATLSKALELSTLLRSILGEPSPDWNHLLSSTFKN